METRLPSPLIYHPQSFMTRESGALLSVLPRSFTDEEAKELARAFMAGASLLCPRCAVPMDARAVPPRRDVSYVRDRVWLVCPRCHRTAVLDRREHR
jgi:hypothetical protein